MVLQKRLDYGSRGHEVPRIPNVPKSARGKRTNRRKIVQMEGVDLLAAVAGTLLKDEENFSNLATLNESSTHAIATEIVKLEQLDEVPPLERGALHESCNGCPLGENVIIPRQSNLSLAENSSTRNETNSVLELLTSMSNVSVKESLTNCTKLGEFASGLGTIPENGAIAMCSPGPSVSADADVGKAVHLIIKSEVEGNAPIMYSLADSMGLDAKPLGLVSSDSSSEVPLYSLGTPCHNSSLICRDGMQLAVDRDDDDNSSGCTHPSTTGKNAFRPYHVGDHRTRKFASKIRKAACTGTYEETKLGFHAKKMSLTRQRTKRTLFKRKKMVEKNLTSLYNRAIFSEASGTSFSTDSARPSCGSEGSHVKLRIKSFMVPELFIEIPENATVGSLKRSVMEAVTAIIEGGLSIGVLFQGKAVQDNNKTLRQAGICHNDKLDSIGFSLEPEAQIMEPDDTNFADAGDMMEPLLRIKPDGTYPENGSSGTNLLPIVMSPSDCPTSDHDSVHSPAGMLQVENSANSHAIVGAAPVDTGSVAIVPVRKSKQYEIGQRRIRRPFSVAEVESLVEAVEALGTGRWRDVKFRAFENAKHRTYVDLKDKWKTLVHTATIAPQQRRGEPVPQELLDRVLATQAYWTEQQAKLQSDSLTEICVS